MEYRTGVGPRSVVTPYAPQPADIVWLSFDPQAGHEQAGTRPALVVSRASFNTRTGFAWFCPTTNRSKGHPFEVALPPDVKTTGVILSDQCKSLTGMRGGPHVASGCPLLC